ncbi:MAG: hypothetical protein KGQ58_04730 [Proteobacteria bacterium]|nr:hypothetical protein [Pseudomonadota bacterium]
MTETLKIQLAVGTVPIGMQFPAIPVGLVSPAGITMDVFESRETGRFAVLHTPKEVLKGRGADA